MRKENNSLPTLPKGWVEVRLGEISSLGAGNPAPQREEYFANGTYPFVRVQDMGSLGNNVYIYDTRDHLNDKAIEKLRLFPEGSVLFTKSGMSILLNQRAILGRDMYVVSHVGVSIPLGGIPSEYIYYWLKKIDFKDLTHATTLPSLQLSKVQEIPTPLPPLPEQHRIVTKIDELFTRLDAGVEALGKVKLQLKRYRQSVLKSAFEGKLTADWREAHKGELEPASVLLEKIKAKREKSGKHRELPPLDTSDLAELPEGWEWARVGNISEKIHYGYTASADSTPVGPKMLRITDIQNDSVNWDTVPYCRINPDDKPSYLLEEGDLVFARTGATVGKSYLIRGQIPEAVFASYLIRIILPKHIIKGYVSNFFQSYSYWLQIRQGQLGIGQPNVNSQTLSKVTLPLAPLKEQAKILEEIERHLSVADEIEKVVEQSLTKSDRLRRGILKKAFEGKLVPQDLNDEPADKLLERIKAEKARQQASVMTPRSRNRRNPS